MMSAEPAATNGNESVPVVGSPPATVESGVGASLGIVVDADASIVVLDGDVVELVVEELDVEEVGATDPYSNAPASA